MSSSGIVACTLDENGVFKPVEAKDMWGKISGGDIVYLRRNGGTHTLDANDRVTRNRMILWSTEGLRSSDGKKNQTIVGYFAESTKVEGQEEQPYVFKYAESTVSPELEDLFLRGVKLPDVKIFDVQTQCPPDMAGLEFVGLCDALTLEVKEHDGPGYSTKMVMDKFKDGIFIVKCTDEENYYVHFAEGYFVIEVKTFHGDGSEEKCVRAIVVDPSTSRLADVSEQSGGHPCIELLEENPAHSYILRSANSVTTLKAKPGTTNVCLPKDEASVVSMSEKDLSESEGIAAAIRVYLEAQYKPDGLTDATLAAGTVQQRAVGIIAALRKYSKFREVASLVDYVLMVFDAIRCCDCEDDRDELRKIAARLIKEHWDAYVEDVKACIKEILENEQVIQARCTGRKILPVSSTRPSDDGITAKRGSAEDSYDYLYVFDLLEELRDTYCGILSETVTQWLELLGAFDFDPMCRRELFYEFHDLLARYAVEEGPVQQEDSDGTPMVDGAGNAIMTADERISSDGSYSTEAIMSIRLWENDGRKKLSDEQDSSSEQATVEVPVKALTYTYKLEDGTNDDQIPYAQFQELKKFLSPMATDPINGYIKSEDCALEADAVTEWGTIRSALAVNLTSECNTFKQQHDQAAVTGFVSLEKVEDMHKNYLPIIDADDVLTDSFGGVSRDTFQGKLTGNA